MESSNDDCKSINSIEHQTSGSSSLNISRTDSTNSIGNHHPMRIEYDPESMWFDYQALFDKTRNCILGLNDDIKVRHTDFKENQLARLVIFNQKHYDGFIKYSLSKIIYGDTQCHLTLISNVQRCIDFCCDEESLVTIQENLPTINLNYLYLVGIVSSLGSRVTFDRQYLMNYFGLDDDDIQSIRTAISYNEIINILKR